MNLEKVLVLPMGSQFWQQTIKHIAQLKFKALFTLHFTEIFANNILTDVSQYIYTFRMDVLVCNEKKSCGDSMYEQHDSTPLFKLRVGQAPDSEGISCAKNCNVQTDVIERALAIKKSIQDKKALPARSNTSSSQKGGIYNRKKSL